MTSRITLLDGAMGTALLARGLPPDMVPEGWILLRPWEVERIHAEHAGAGAEVLLSCTFNAARLEVSGLDRDVEEICRRAVGLARRAARSRLDPAKGPAGRTMGRGGTRDGPHRRVAGCVGPTGLVRGSGAGPPDAELRARFERPFRALAAAGADLLWTETHLSLREARAAVAAARRTGRTVVATMYLGESQGGLDALDGTPGPECLRALWLDGARAVGVNCVAPGRALTALVARAAAAIPVPLVVRPNAGLPGAPVGPARFAAAGADALRAGARMVGGCCGAGPDHLRALGAAILRG